MKKIDKDGLLLCDIQANVFELSIDRFNCSSQIFIRRFSNSNIAQLFDNKILLNESYSEYNILDLLEEGLIDYVAMDIKNSLEKYDLTGGAKINKDHILRSIEILKNSGIEYEFRTTLVKEFHEKEDMYAMGKMLEGCPNLYLQKFVVSDGVINKNLHPVDEDLANSFVDILEQYIDNVELRGY